MDILYSLCKIMATNPLSELFDRFCSDKGTFWQSKHHYANAYHAILGPIRERVKTLVEIGIGEDTAPSVASWLRYFPYAHIYAIDIKNEAEFKERAEPGGATEKLIKHQGQFGCEYDRNMWRNSRAHLTLGVDASDTTQLERLVHLPPSFDVIIDDGSHKMRDQEATLRALWPRLNEGGIYIIEDILVGALPWSAEHATQVPSNNTRCGNECFFPQRPSEPPFMYDRYAFLKRQTTLADDSSFILDNNDWFWVLTGMHKGGGLDASLIIRKSGGDIPLEATSSSGINVIVVCATVVWSWWWRRHVLRANRRGYSPLAT